ncbi:PEP-CTERM sorting domain-containing protein [Thermosulfuriphilus sp.]
MKKLIYFLLVMALILLSGTVLAGPNDGSHYFSTDSDSAPGGGNGDIYKTDEDSSFYYRSTIDLGAVDQEAEVDALSSAQHPYVDLPTMFLGPVHMIFSIDGDSDLYEWIINGPPPPRTGSLDGHFPNNPPHQVLGPKVHDDEGDLGLQQYDLDALESGEHYPPYPNPFPSPAFGSAFFSVERAATLDSGDIYVSPGGPSGGFSLYLDDNIFGPIVGFDPSQEQLDALIVFDLLGGTDSFDMGHDIFTSDTIFFSLAPGNFDPTGDNIYFYSALGIGGLYFDPHLPVNVDALDVHPIPEPATLTLLGSGLGLLGLVRRRKKSSF